MSVSDKYLIDSNCLITAKNHYYNPKFCSQFWDVIRALHIQGVLYSIDKVKDELLNGEADDYLSVEIAQDSFFEYMWLKTSFTAPKFKIVANEAQSWFNQNPDKRQKALNDFLSEDKADSFLLAAALEHNYTIVTFETLIDNNASKRIKIPNIAEKLNIKYCNLYELLQKYCNPNFMVNL